MYDDGFIITDGFNRPGTPAISMELTSAQASSKSARSDKHSTATSSSSSYDNGVQGPAKPGMSKLYEIKIYTMLTRGFALIFGYITVCSKSSEGGPMQSENAKYRELAKTIYPRCRRI